MDSAEPAEPAEGKSPETRRIAGMSCRFRLPVETLTQFWDMLLSKEDQ
jgi:hypothetical protein